MKSADNVLTVPGRKNLPGTLWESHGAWHWRVRLPGKDARSDNTLKMPFTGARIPAGESTRSLAESAAWRLWEDAARRNGASATRAAITVNDLCDGYCKHAAIYYGASGEAGNCAVAIRQFRNSLGGREAESLAHPDMIGYRDSLAARGYARTTVNKYLGYAKRMLAWALDNGLVSARLKAECSAAAPLKPRRGMARETAPVGAVPGADVDAVCEVLPPSLADMVRVNRLTGMRPGEVCGLRWRDIERRDGIWVYRPAEHKNAWRDRPRVVVIGPRAQGVLEKYRGDADDGFLFSPRLAVAEEYRRSVADAKCHRARERVKGTPRAVGDRWNVRAYNRAISRACVAAGVGHWHANQLRHSCATEVRRRFGIEAAGAVLGHTLGLRITNRYSFEAAEDEIINAATPPMLELG